MLLSCPGVPSQSYRRSDWKGLSFGKKHIVFDWSVMVCDISRDMDPWWCPEVLMVLVQGGPNSVSLLHSLYRQRCRSAEKIPYISAPFRFLSDILQIRPRTDEYPSIYTLEVWYIVRRGFSQQSSATYPIKPTSPRSSSPQRPDSYRYWLLSIRL